MFVASDMPVDSLQWDRWSGGRGEEGRKRVEEAAGFVGRAFEIVRVTWHEVI